MPDPTISVVICTYNRAETLRRAVESVMRQETNGAFSFEIVVIDDGSTDNTRETVEALASESPAPVRHVFEGGGGCIPVTRNRGIAEARGEWVAFFDDDQLAEPGWLQGLLDTARRLDVLLVGGPRRLDVPADRLARLGPERRAMLGEEMYPTAPIEFDGKRLPTTGNLMIHRRVFEAIGTFDVSMAFSGEDADLLRRARAAGFPIWTAPGAMVVHLIPEYRLDLEYFRWVSYRWGANFARMDLKDHGLAGMLARCAARCAQALAGHVPRLALASVGKNDSRYGDLHCLLWRAEGYCRQAVRTLSPTLFAQTAFFDRLEFRKERQSFKGGAQGTQGSGRT